VAEARNERRSSTLSKQLTFVDATTEDISDAIKRTSKDFGNELTHARQVFWVTVLSQSPSDVMLPFRNSSIRYWVRAFNNWAHERNERRTISGYGVTGAEIQKIFKLDPKCAMALLLKMNPSLARPRVVTKEWLQNSSANFLQIASAGVILARSVSAHHKLRYCFSLFDFDASEGLDVDQFAMAFRSLYKSLCLVFEVPESDGLSGKEVGEWATRLFTHVGKMVGFDPNFTARPHILLEEFGKWVFGDYAEELSTTWRLLLQRFSAERYGYSGDTFCGGLAVFRLDWKNPVNMPPEMEECSVHKFEWTKCRILDREDVVAAKDFFRKLETTETLPQVRHAIHELTAHEEGSFKDMAHASFRSVPANHHLTLDQLFTILCPCATPKHIKMFYSWCHQHDRLLHSHAEFSQMEVVQDIHENFHSKPELPENEKNNLSQMFKKIDTNDRGFISQEQLVESGTLTVDMATSMFQAHDLDGNGFMDEVEFIHMMCPEHYRYTPKNSGAAADILSVWVRHRKKESGAIVTMGDQGTYHLVHESTGCLDHTAAPAAFKDFPPDHIYEKWDRAFNSLAVKKQLQGEDSDFVDIGALRKTGVVHEDVAAALVEKIDPDKKTGFTRGGFLAAMCEAHGYRIPERSYTRDSKDSLRSNE
jgi:hypothetical protein